MKKPMSLITNPPSRHRSHVDLKRKMLLLLVSVTDKIESNILLRYLAFFLWSMNCLAPVSGHSRWVDDFVDLCGSIYLAHND